MTLQELLAELLKLDRNEVVEGLHTQAQPIWQAIFNKGHSTATAKLTEEKAQLEGKVAGLTTERDQALQQVRQMQEKAPDVQTVRQQYEQQILQLQEKHKQELAARDSVIVAERTSRVFSDLQSKLVALKVDPDYADVLVNKPEVRKRLRFAAEGKPEVLQADAEVPIVAASGKDPLDVLAKELQAGVPPKFLTVDSDRGSGTNGSRSSGAAGAGKGYYDKLREEVKEAEKSKAPAEGDSLESRFGLTRSA